MTVAPVKKPVTVMTIMADDTTSSNLYMIVLNVILTLQSYRWWFYTSFINNYEETIVLKKLGIIGRSQEGKRLVKRPRTFARFVTW